jgi:hypothetical protein
VQRKLILVELNEVPYRVIETYCRERPDSTLAGLLPQCEQLETLTEDQFALDPWISWPTFHRGVTDQKHEILHLGQVDEAIDQSFPPIWRLLKERGLDVGVFGSLHSSSVPADAQEYAFYVPDYFDSKVFAHPLSLRPFQQLNLMMTRQSARNVTRKLPLGELARFMATVPTSGLRFATIADSAAHLLRESFDRSLRIRRRAFQPVVMADLFLRQMRLTRPHFATFYTNHVAAAMHRYWGAAFPQDYSKPLDGEWIRKYSGEIRFAMDKFDVILKAVLQFVRSHPEYTLMVASSMGQAAIPAEKTFEFLTITDLGRFMNTLGVPAGRWEARPAMVPVQCVVVQEPYRDRALEALRSLVIDGVAIKEDRRPIAPLSFDERERGFLQLFVQFDGYKGSDSAAVQGGKSVRLAEAGLGLMVHEDGVNCTAQHVPNGSLLIYNQGTSRRQAAAREQVSTVDVAPSILRFFGFETPAQMQGRPSINFGAADETPSRSRAA